MSVPYDCPSNRGIVDRPLDLGELPAYRLLLFLQSFDLCRGLRQAHDGSYILLGSEFHLHGTGAGIYPCARLPRDTELLPAAAVNDLVE